MMMHEMLGMPAQDFSKLERLHSWLVDWARWRENYRPNLGAKSPSFYSSSVYHASDLFDGVDDFCYQAIEAAVDDLAPAYGAAIMKRYCGEAHWRFPRGNYEEMLDKAHEVLLVSLPKRNVVL